MRALLAGAALLIAAASAAAQTLGPGDSIRITVFQNPDLSVEARLSESGAISYPLLGEVELAGQTPAAAGERIAARLRSGKFLREPQVTVIDFAKSSGFTPVSFTVCDHAPPSEV